MDETRRRDLVRRLVSRAATDPELRRRLLSSPRAAVEEELGVTLPADLELEVLEETATRIYLVLPLAGAAPELEDEELAKAAGGGTAALRSTPMVAISPHMTDVIVYTRS
ncbi:MAG TPA: NHLP leader peptide family RiPP precursor [Thermoanaerobaculia bacterium]|nr:NHLP leader peptide family RiPP precursor [Thermoanaerobaculia bacterium]